MEELYIDTGQPEAVVRRRVPVGTLVMLRQPPVGLLKSRLAAPGMDDRSGVATLVRTHQALRERRPAWDVIAPGNVASGTVLVDLAFDDAGDIVGVSGGIAMELLVTRISFADGAPKWVRSIVDPVSIDSPVGFGVAVGGGGRVFAGGYAR